VAPYGHFPSDCGQCDTYGPATYLSYVPFEVAAPWNGHWDSLPAAHAAASVFDGICLVGMLTLGWRLGGVRLGLALATGWAAFPFTAYALESNTNDELVAAALIWGLVLFARPLGRGLMLGLAVMSKFTPAILLLAWWRHPFPKGQRRLGWLWYLAGDCGMDDRLGDSPRRLWRHPHLLVAHDRLPGESLITILHLGTASRSTPRATCIDWYRRDGSRGGGALATAA
jgi:hypothetical protein